MANAALRTPSASPDLHLRDENFLKKFVKGLSEMQTSDKYCDALVKSSDGVVIKCHRVVLASASSYFDAMFSSGMKESESGTTISLSDISGETLKAIIDYMYTSKIRITDTNVSDIAQASDIFTLDGLKIACETFMIDHVNPQNCIHSYKFSQLYRMIRLEKTSRHYMLTQLQAVVHSKQENEFLEISVDDLIEYISDDFLDESNEDTIFEAVVTWVKHNLKERASFFERVIHHVRLAYCSSAYLNEVVKKEPLMLTDKCTPLLLEALSFHLGSNETRWKSRKASSSPSLNILILGGVKISGAHTKKCWCIDPNESEGPWKYLTRLPTSAEDFATTVIPKGIVLTGGFVPSILSHVSNSCWLFSTKMMLWKKKSDLLVGRYQHGSATHGNHVYIMGGADEDEALSSVHQLDTNSWEWREMEPMPSAIRSPVTATHGRYIYVFSGVEGDLVNYDFSTSTFAFDTVWKTWAVKQRMPIGCDGGTAVPIADTIYLISDGCCLSYSPEADIWTVLTVPFHMHCFRSGAIWDDSIIVGIDSREPSACLQLYRLMKSEVEPWRVALPDGICNPWMLSIVM